MSATAVAPANKAVVFKGGKKKILKAAKRGLISPKQMEKIKANA